MTPVCHDVFFNPFFTNPFVRPGEQGKLFSQAGSFCVCRDVVPFRHADQFIKGLCVHVYGIVTGVVCIIFSIDEPPALDGSYSGLEPAFMGVVVFGVDNVK